MTHGFQDFRLKYNPYKKIDFWKDFPTVKKILSHRVKKTKSPLRSGINPLISCWRLEETNWGPRDRTFPVHRWTPLFLVPWEKTPNLDKSNRLGVAYLNSRGGLSYIAGLRKVSCQQDFRLVHCLRLVLTEECFADGRGLFRGVQIGSGIHLLQRLDSCAAKLGWGRQECVLRHLPDLSTPMRNQTWPLMRTFQRTLCNYQGLQLINLDNIKRYGIKARKVLKNLE